MKKIFVDVIPFVKKRVVDVSSRRKRHSQTDEREILRHVEAADWTMPDVEKDFQCFSGRLRFVKKAKVNGSQFFLRNESNAREEKVYENG